MTFSCLRCALSLLSEGRKLREITFPAKANMNMASNEIIPTSVNDEADVTRLGTHVVGHPESEAVEVDEKGLRTYDQS